MAARDECLALQQALNLDIQIRLLGACAPKTPHRDVNDSISGWFSDRMFIAA